ncbi:hypothetical protein [Clostridium mediterraneense]|uniref:hypothetical protein n=1 Tax=Clostridium mediterraneense TaxID=1805472 RepID=UPI000835FE3B|nr:hypothetical protein [Clostridium mediterraneense]
MRSTDLIIIEIIMSGFLIIVLNALLKILIISNNNKIINFIKSIISNMAGVVALITVYITSYGVGVMMMALIFIILIVLITFINKYITAGIINYKSIIYLSAIITLVTSSYKGGKLLDIYIRLTGDTKGILSGYCNYKGVEYFTKVNIRKLCYEISILLYIITRVISMTEIKAFNGINEQLISSLVAEIFLTFVAIDCYICTFKNNIIEKNTRECEMIKEKYLEKYKVEYNKYKSNTYE